MNKALAGLIVVVIIILTALVLGKGGAPASLSPVVAPDSPPADSTRDVIPSPSHLLLPATEKTKVTVDITAQGFIPATLTTKAGTQVTWLNKSGGTIMIASDPHPSHTNYPPLNLGEVAGSGTVSLIFDKAGSYGYHNHLNPSQRAAIVVQ